MVFSVLLFIQVSSDGPHEGIPMSSHLQAVSSSTLKTVPECPLSYTVQTKMATSSTMFQPLLGVTVGLSHLTVFYISLIL